MTVGSEFIFYMVELARFLVVFLKNQKVKEDGSKVSRMNKKRPVIDTTLAKPPKMALKKSIYFVTDCSFTADGSLLKPTGSLKTTLQMTRFRGVSVQEFGFR